MYVYIKLNALAECAGSKDNPALALLVAMPNLNTIHALYILSEIPCMADLAAAISQVMQHTQHTATHCNALQHTETYCNTLQHTTTHCNALQHTAPHCNTLQRNTAMLQVRERLRGIQRDRQMER